MTGDTVFSLILIPRLDKLGTAREILSSKEFKSAQTLYLRSLHEKSMNYPGYLSFLMSGDKPERQK
jgi:hypothetical protein